MGKWGIGAAIRPLIAVGCFVMAALSYFGVLSKDNPGDQRLFASLWVLAGLLWILRITLYGKRQRSRTDTDTKE